MIRGVEKLEGALNLLMKNLLGGGGIKIETGY